MTKEEIQENFDNIPEEPLTPESLEHLKPVEGYLKGYYEELGDGTRELLGIETGEKWLDERTLGLRGLIVLAGEPGAGKTSLALQVAFGACKKGTPVIFYSLEQGRSEIITIILSQLSGIGYQDIRLDGKNRESQLKEAKETLESVAGSLYIRSDDPEQEDIKLEALEGEIQAIKAKTGTTPLVVVDQVQDIQTEEKHTTQTEREGYIIRTLKKIATKSGACILGVSHLNKASFDKGEISLAGIKGSVDLTYKPDSVWILVKNPDQSKETPTRKPVILFLPKARDYKKDPALSLNYIGHSRKFEYQGEYTPSTENNNGY